LPLNAGCTTGRWQLIVPPGFPCCHPGPEAAWWPANVEPPRRSPTPCWSARRDGRGPGTIETTSASGDSRHQYYERSAGWLRRGRQLDGVGFCRGLGRCRANDQLLASPIPKSCRKRFPVRLESSPCGRGSVAAAVGRWRRGGRGDPLSSRPMTAAILLRDSAPVGALRPAAGRWSWPAGPQPLDRRRLARAELGGSIELAVEAGDRTDHSKLPVAGGICKA